MNETITITLPPRFLQDRDERELSNGIEIKRNTKGVTIEVNHEQYDDLLSDARYYANEFGPAAEMGDDGKGIRASARATLRKLEAIEPPAAPAPKPEPKEIIEVRLPPMFFDDRFHRGLPCGAIVERKKTYVKVQLNETDADDILNEARRYADRATGICKGQYTLWQSAESTVRILEALH